MRLQRKQILILALCALLVQATPPMRYAHAQNEDLDNLFRDEENGDANAGDVANPPPIGAPDATNLNGGQPGFPQDAPMDAGGGAFPNVQGGRNAFGGRGSSARATKTAGKSLKAPTTAPGGKPSIADAKIEDITNENYPELIESFDYPNAEIADIVKAISQLTGKNFIVDPSVHGKISIIAPTQITVAEAYKAFLSALAINGFAVVPSGKFLKVKSARNAQRDSIDTFSGSYFPTSDAYITRIVHLKHISAEDVNKNLRILPSKDGEMTPYAPTNTLIISDYGSNMERMMKIINELDQPGFEEQLKVMPIRYAKAKDLADLINKIINKDSGPGANQPPGFGAGIPRFRSRGGTAGGGTPEELSLVAPDDRTNAIIVVGNTAGIEKVRELVHKLDYKLNPADAGGVFVYYVRYGDAEAIAKTLQGVTTGGTGTSASTPTTGFGGANAFSANRVAAPLASQAIFGGDVKIMSDKSTNSLVITASKQDYEVVSNILTKLDVPRDQVFVEAIIMEMSTDKKNAWSPTYYYLDPSSNGVGRVGFAGSPLSTVADPSNDAGAILGFGGGSSVQVNIAGKTITVPSLLGFINILQTSNEGNILSTPHILALDNEEAEIEVGDQIPIAQNQQATTGGVVASSIQFDQATIHLKLTPYIRPDSDVVRLKLEQTIKQPSTTTIKSTTLSQQTTILSDRTIKTNIVVNNGDTAVLGGLARDQDSLIETKIPVLGDIPVIGWLFKSKSLEKQKLNLVVFLTPKILRSTRESHELLSERVNKRIDWLKKNFDGRDPYGQVIDELPRSSRTAEEDQREKPRVSGRAGAPADPTPIKKMEQ